MPTKRILKLTYITIICFVTWTTSLKLHESPTVFSFSHEGMEIQTMNGLKCTKVFNVGGCINLFPPMIDFIDKDPIVKDRKYVVITSSTLITVKLPNGNKDFTVWELANEGRKKLEVNQNGEFKVYYKYKGFVQFIVDDGKKEYAFLAKIVDV